jgi:Ca2+ transporting ATPase
MTPLLATGACVNSNAHPKLEIKNNHTVFEQIGNKTECALLEMAHKFGYEFKNIRDKQKDKILKIFPFSSERKRMSTIF